MAADAAGAKFLCPSCGKRWTWKPTNAGRKAKCTCGTMIDVPIEPPEAGPAADDDLFELAPAPEPPRRPPTSTATVIPYHGLEAIKEKEKHPARRAIDDPFQGARRKNLIVPITLIAIAVALNLFVWLHDAGGRLGVSLALLRMITVMAIEIPVLIVASVLAVKLFEANLGPIIPAMLKLTSIALLPDAVSDFLYVIGLISGGNSGIAATVNGQIGSLFGWVATLILYMWFFIYYFELDLTDAYRMIIVIWAVRTLGGIMVTAYLYHH